MGGALAPPAGAASVLTADEKGEVVPRVIFI
nr:MAG TPA: hypothetical protein [Caudoviricetes sp.]